MAQPLCLQLEGRAYTDNDCPLGLWQQLRPRSCHRAVRSCERSCFTRSSVPAGSETSLREAVWDRGLAGSSVGEVMPSEVMPS
jgi:hypothetical protein